MHFFNLSRLAWLLVDPANLGVFLVMAAALLSFTRFAKAGRLLLAALASGAFLMICLPVSQWIAAPLENRFAPAPLPACVNGILVLGGGGEPFLSAARGIPIYLTNEGTILAAMDLARRYPKAMLVFAGGGELSGRVPETEVARAIFAQAGIDPARVVYEGRSHNTGEDFAFTRQLLHPQKDQTWILVTSALHMPRSMGIAQRLGWDMLAWPTDFRTAGGGRFLLHGDFSRNLSEFVEATREWIGLAAYRITGRTASLLPSALQRAPSCSHFQAGG